MTEKKELSKFEELLKYDCSKYTDKVTQGKVTLTYLSWANAWAEFVKKYPEATYKIKHFPDEKGLLKPYIFEESLGYMVYTEVTAGGITHEMWLPVMDYNNKAMTNKPYSIENKSGYKTNVNKANMFDINKSIMRCLTKNLAMFGLGLYIYQKEDLPIEDDVVIEKTKEKPKTEKKELSLDDRYKTALTYIKDCKDETVLKSMEQKVNILLLDLKEAKKEDAFNNLAKNYAEKQTELQNIDIDDEVIY